MEKIAIYGFGGFSKDVSVIIDEINKEKKKYDFRGYFDDSDKCKVNSNFLGGIDELNNYPETINLVLAFGKPSIICHVKSKIINKKIKYPNLIHPKSNVDFLTLKIGQGNIINVGTVIGRDVIMGDYNMINSNCIIGHDVQIGDFNVFSPQVAVSGNVKIHNNVFLGLNCSVVQGIEVEDEVHIGAKSLVLKKGKKGKSYFGVPALLIKK